MALIFVFVYSKHSLVCGDPCGSWFAKCLNFEQKLPTWTVYHTVLESSHPEDTKNLYHVWYFKMSQKGLSSDRLIYRCGAVSPSLFSEDEGWYVM